MSSIALGDRTPIDRIAVNRRRAIELTVGTGLLVGLIVALLSLLVVAPLFALIVLVAVAAVVALAAWEGCEGLVVRLLPSQPADAQAHARLINLVDGLCITAGVPAPDLQVLAAGAPNALVAGRNPRRATLVVTQGLVDRLTLIELEAVVARELSQIKGYDILPATVAVALFGVLPRRGPLSAISSTGLRLALDEQRDERADLGGVALTRYPPALLAAMEKMAAAGTAVPDVSPAVAHLWMADPGTGVHGYPPLAERIEALREL